MDFKVYLKKNQKLQALRAYKEILKDHAHVHAKRSTNTSNISSSLNKSSVLPN